MTEVSAEQITGVIIEALSRYEKAREKYGRLDLDNDGRDFLHEAEEELLDLINYAVFEVLRLRRLRSRNPTENSIP